MVNKFLVPFFIIPLLSILFFSSSGCDQSEVIEEEKFIRVYTDVIIAIDTTSLTAESTNSLLIRILKKHNTTLDNYKSTLEFYNQDSERWEKFFAKAIARLEEKRKISEN